MSINRAALGAAAMIRVVVLGGINVDLVVRASRLPGPGETVLGGAFERHFGGKGANQAVAAARMGASVSLAGAVGRDRDGGDSVASLVAEGVDVSRVRRVDAPTGVAIIAVAPSGENQIVVSPGANAELTADDGALTDFEAGPGVLLVSLEVPMRTVTAALNSASRLGLTPVLAPAPAQVLPPALLAGTIVVPNRGELLAATAEDDQDVALQKLAAAGARAIVVTLGAAGALLVESDRRTAFPALPVDEVVDTTGAGDTFSGALAVRIAEGHSLHDAVAAAVVAAGLSVTARGARGGMPSRDEVQVPLAGRTCCHAPRAASASGARRAR